MLLAFATLGALVVPQLVGGDSSANGTRVPEAESKAVQPSRPTVSPPRIAAWPIPFPPARRRQTAGYAQRHYGIESWRIRGPNVIVQHYTASDSLRSTWNTFAANTADPELGELPGVCSHFLIGKDGRIYRLARLDTMCRHTVGLNWTALGIEHVGMSDGQILGNRAQLESSLRLTLWLMQRYRIRLRDVIGHSESLRSPYRRERYVPWRCQTHGDWSKASMGVYRRGLRLRATRAGLGALAPLADLGGPRGSTPGCS